MRVLFVSVDSMAGNLVRVLQNEGHDVKMYINEPCGKRNFDGLVSKTENWEDELSWVGKDGLIIFDDTGFGRQQENLRKEGYTVFGGSELGDKLELNRYFGQEMFRHVGIKTVPLLDFHNINDAIAFLVEHKGTWVIKQNSSEKDFNYIGEFEDASDAISILENYRDISAYTNSTITLHKRIYGVEMGVARYFNGTDWVGPIEISFEHKKLFPGDLGPTTSEMGTLAWYDADENNRLFQETLAKLKSFLQEADFRGDISINCIVNADGAFPTEATARLGCPITHLQGEIQTSPWGEFLYAVASGKQYDLQWNKGYGLVALVAAPPFPFYFKGHTTSSRGTPLFLGSYATSQSEHIHFEEIALENNRYVLSDDRGYVLYVTSMGESVEEAQERLYTIIKDIHVPKLFYRNDIGQAFLKHDREQLELWGYL